MSYNKEKDLEEWEKLAAERPKDYQQIEFVFNYDFPPEEIPIHQKFNIGAEE